MRKKLLLSLLVAFVSLGVVFADTYYVKPNGSNSNDGLSEATAFATIQKAADVMVAGDTAIILGGTYRETVVPANSGTDGNPITFKAKDGETVVIRGDDVAGGWSVHSGNIYKTTLSYQTDEVYINGSMINMARWPNVAETDPFLAKEDAWNFADSGSTQDKNQHYQTLVDSEINFPDDHFNGYRIWFNGPKRFWARTGVVTDSTTGQLTYYLENDILWAQVLAGKDAPYFLYGKLDALDVENEWFQDDNNVLYVYAPGGGVPNGVSAKRRRNGFLLDDKEYISIDGIDFFATRVQGENADHNIIDNAQFEYVTSFYEIANPQERELSDFTLTANTDGTGVYFSGTGNVIKNSVVEKSWGDGITLGGDGNRVERTLIHDVNYIAGMGSGVSPIGTNHVITYNTIYNTGRSGIRIRFSNGSKTNNHIYNIGITNGDLGGIYSNEQFGYYSAGTEIAYNWIHDVFTSSVKAGGPSESNNGRGIHMDNRSSGILIHHNVVWNVPNSGIQLNWGNEDLEIYNNTFFDVGNAMDRWSNGESMVNVKVYNNLSDNNNWEGTDKQKNLQQSSSYWVDPVNEDFRLASNAPAIDYGRLISGITDDYEGAAPDAGAYEFGGTDWGAGHDWSGDGPEDPPPPPPPSTGDPVTLSATNDAYGRAGSYSGTAYGTTDPNNLVVKDSHLDNYTREAYLQFDVSSISSVATAVLRVYGANTQDSSTVTVRAYSSADDSWSESTVTYGSRPLPGSLLDSTQINGTLEYYEFDLTSFVQSEVDGDDIVTIVLTGTGDEDRMIEFNSSEESANTPELVVTPASSTLTVAPSDDAYGRGGSYDGIAYGSTTPDLLRVKDSHLDAYTRKSYFKFDVSGASSVTSATLRLYGLNAQDSSSVTVQVYGSNDDSWDESTVTYGSDPTESLLVDSASVNDTAQYYEFDVTSFVSSELGGDGVVTFVVTGTGNEDRVVEFNSKEDTANAPELVIDE